MVAMSITIVSLAATVLAFRDATRVNQSVTFREDMSDNIRAGMNLIEQDLIETGTGIPTGGITVPSFLGGSCASGSYSNVNRPIFTGTATFPVCNSVLPAIEPGNAMGPLITSPDATSIVNTDIISILYADNTASTTAGVKGMNAAPINGASCPNGSISSNTVTVIFDPNCFNLNSLAAEGVSINPGDLIMFSNANGNAIQTVSTVNIGSQTLTFTSGDAFNFNSTGAPLGTLTQLQNYNLNAQGNKVFNVGTYPPTTATRVWLITYYLDNVTDPTHVRLVRQVNFNGGQAVGETLENLQFTYNFNDGKAVNDINVPAGYSESQIRSVNLYLGARSTNKSSQNNKYIRENFQTQVSLRSMAYVSQYK
jgi:hypothetical protein